MCCSHCVQCWWCVPPENLESNAYKRMLKIHFFYNSGPSAHLRCRRMPPHATLVYAKAYGEDHSYSYRTVSRYGRGALHRTSARHFKSLPAYITSIFMQTVSPAGNRSHSAVRSMVRKSAETRNNGWESECKGMWTNRIEGEFHVSIRPGAPSADHADNGAQPSSISPQS